jgi:hypothetical protein
MRRRAGRFTLWCGAYTLLGSVNVGRHRVPAYPSPRPSRNIKGTRLPAGAHAPQIAPTLYSIHFNGLAVLGHATVLVCACDHGRLRLQRPHQRVRVRRRHATPTLSGLYV